MSPLFLILLFLISPFFSMVASFWMLFKKNMTRGGLLACLIVISMFWGILAFSQKSLAAEDTDCIRYYQSMELYETLNITDCFQIINFLELLNFIFYPVSVIAVSITGNVQIMSCLWTFLAYILTYISIRRLMEYYGNFNQKDFAKVILVCTFCFMAFVQISELLKNSAAFAVFFYALTLYMSGGNKLYTMIFVVIAIGLHPSVMMLLPLFLYKVLNTKFAIVLGVALFLISLLTNIIELALSILPGSGYFELLLNRFEDYGDGQTGSTHYVAIQLALLCSALYLWYKHKYNKEISYAINLVLLYFIISNINYYNLVAYLRFSIFSHWLFALIYIWYIKVSFESKNISTIKKILVIFMLIMTTRWTLSRTVSGGYCSSYMDNSLPKIMFSTSYNYLSVDYEK